MSLNNVEPTAFNKTLFLTKKQGGFIITLEFVLIMTILGIGLFFGTIAIRDALVKYYVNKQSQDIVVIDSRGTILGKAVDFDEHEAPRILYIDRTLEQSNRALIGIRDDRFTGREPLYYETQSCTGQPCIKTVSDEGTDSIGIDKVTGTGAVGYIYGLQGSPTYAIGPSNTGLPGFLFRETTSECPFNRENVRSRWMSQKVVVGEPCETYSLAEPQGESAQTGCLINLGEACQCTGNYSEQGDILQNYLGPIDTLLVNTTLQINQVLQDGGLQLPGVEVGEICCPAGTRLDEENLVTSVVYYVLNTLVNDLNLGEVPIVGPTLQETIDPILAPLAGQVQCVAAIKLKSAESVPHPDDQSINALEELLPPFNISSPALNTTSNDWISTQPHGEGEKHFSVP